MSGSGVLSVEAVRGIVSLMRKGGALVYYRGYLPNDRVTRKRDGGRAAKIAALADEMLALGSPAGHVIGEGTTLEGRGVGTLTQRRVGEFDYEYVFTRL